MRGRRSTKTREQRQCDIYTAVNRSGFTGEEIVQILVDWQGWSKATVTQPNGETIVFNNQESLARSLGQ